MVDKVTQNVIADDAVGNAQMDDNAVGNAEMADLAVDTAELVDDSVTSAKLAAGAVDATALATDAVETDKIAADAVNGDKIADDAIASEHLADNAVTNAAMADNAVNTAEIVDAAVTGAKIANLTITNANIADGTLTDAKFVNPPLLQGKHTTWLPAPSLISSATDGATFQFIDFSAANKPTIPVLAFDPATEQHCEVMITLPKSWNLGDCEFQMQWFHPTTATNFGVVWRVRKAHFGDGDSLDTTYGNAAQQTDTGGTTSDLYLSPTITVTGGTPADNDLTMFQFSRVAADGSDTMTVDAYLLGIIMRYTLDTGNDA